MSLSNFFLILRERYKIFLLCFFGVCVLVALVRFMVPPYKAEAVVVVDMAVPDPVAGFVLAGDAMVDYMPTQVDIAASDYIARKVVKALKMDLSPELNQLWLDHTDGQGDKITWLGHALQKHLSVKAGKESNLITIGFRAADPSFASATANAFATAYVETNIEMRAKPALDSAQWLHTQVSTSHDRLDELQRRISDYRRTHQLVASDDRSDVEGGKLADLMQQLTVLQAQTSAAKSKEGLAGGSLSLPEVADDPVIARLRGDIADAQARLAEASVDLGVNNPTYIQAKSHLDALQAQLAHEQQISMNGFGRSKSIGQTQESDLEAAIAAQRVRMLSISQQRGELNVLLQEEQAAEASYQEVSRRYTQATLQSGSVQTNILVLSAATPPAAPSPSAVLYCAIAVFLGTVMGVLGALYREISDRRIRFSRDIELAVDVPLLADFCSPTRPKWPRLTSRPKLLQVTNRAM